MLGQKNLLVFSGICGCVHMLGYALAQTKVELFVAASFVCLTMFSFPTISSIKSNNVEETEQGLVQGAVYAVKSLAAAVGPTLFTLIYRATEDSRATRGTMWYAGVVLYAISVVFTTFLPKEEADCCYSKAVGKQEERGSGVSGEVGRGGEGGEGQTGVNDNDMTEALLRVGGGDRESSDGVYSGSNNKEEEQHHRMF